MRGRLLDSPFCFLAYLRVYSSTDIWNGEPLNDKQTINAWKLEGQRFLDSSSR